MQGHCTEAALHRAQAGRDNGTASEAAAQDSSAFDGGLAQGEQAPIDELYSFNRELCDRLSPDRPLPDGRPADCRAGTHEIAGLAAAERWRQGQVLTKWPDSEEIRR